MRLKSTFEKIESLIGGMRRFFNETKTEDVSRAYLKVLKKLPDVSHLKNIVLFSGVATLLILVLFAERFSSLYEHLPQSPQRGGIFIEGTVGEIRQLNPLYTPTNPTEDLVASIIFSGLTQNTSNRNVRGNLAESWEISQDKKNYTFKLKNGIYWHDGERLDSSDVLFTFQTIQNPDANSPRMATWRDVKIEAPDERTVVFSLPSPLASFIYLTDVPIIPEHILKEVDAGDLRSAEFSLKPIGSGPYVFSELKQIRDIEQVHLKANERYHAGRPYIEEVIVKSFPNYGALTNAYNQRDVMSVSRVRPSDIERPGHLPEIKVNNLVIPEFDVLFYNLRAEHTKEKVLRESISLSIDKEKIVKEIYGGEAVAIHSAILPGYIGYNSKLRQEFNLDSARKKLIDGGYTLSAEGNLQKNNEDVILRLITTDEDGKRKKAELLAKMIGELGISVNVESYPLNTYIEEMIRPRNFDLLLVTKNLGADSDIYTFYHANMENDPGLNLSGIKSREIDKYLEEARMSHDPKFRSTRYSEISRLINEAAVATFLSWPSYLYGVSSEVKGEIPHRIINPKDRFWNIEDWYILSERDY